MSFTPINSGDHVSSTLETAIEEFKVALNERESILGKSVTGGWSSDASIAIRAKETLTDIRSAIPALLTASSGGLCFRKSDLTRYADIDDFLSDAGYPDGWIETEGLAISERGIWTQLYDVFAALINVTKMELSGGAGSYSTFTRTGSLSASNESAWDSAVADTPGSTSSPYLWWAGAFGYQWNFRGPSVQVTVNTSGYNESLCDSIVTARTACDIQSGGSYFGSNIINISVQGGEATFDINLNGDNDGRAEFDIGVDLEYGIDLIVEYEITTSEPASAPATPAADHDALWSFVLQATSADEPFLFCFIFDITPALTYG